MTVERRELIFPIRIIVAVCPAADDSTDCTRRVNIGRLIQDIAAALLALRGPVGLVVVVADGAAVSGIGHNSRASLSVVLIRELGIAVVRDSTSLVKFNTRVK